MDEKTLQQHFKDYPWLMLCLLYCAVLFSILPNLLNPELDGDAATRFLGAPHLIGYNPYREWLPYVQLWGSFVVLFQLPFVTLYVFPIIHVLIFLFFAVKIFYQFGPSIRYQRLCFLTALSLFLYIPIIHRLSYQPYQEIPYAAFMAGIIYYTLRNHFPWQLWFVAMFIREQVWIYWGCWLLAQLFYRRTRIFQHPATYIISSVPIVWSYITSRSVIPIVSDAQVSVDTGVLMKRVFDALDLMKLHNYHYVFLCVFFAGLACFLLRHYYTVHAQCIMTASVLSMFVTILYLIVTNPYAVTPHNPRPLMPLLFLVPLWVFFLSFETVPFYRLRVTLQMLFIPALLCASNLGLLLVPFTAQQHPFYEKAKTIIQEHPQPKQTFCFSGLDHWTEFMKYIVGTFRYEKFYEGGTAAHTALCDTLYEKIHVPVQPESLVLPNGTILTRRNIPHAMNGN